MIFLIRQHDDRSTTYRVEANSLSDARLKLRNLEDFEVVGHSVDTYYDYKIKEDEK